MMLSETVILQISAQRRQTPCSNYGCSEHALLSAFPARTEADLSYNDHSPLCEFLYVGTLEQVPRIGG